MNPQILSSPDLSTVRQQAAASQRLPLQTAGYRPGDCMPQGSAISTLSVPLRHTGLEPDFGTPLGASDARVASSAGEPGSADFVSQGCGSAVALYLNRRLRSQVIHDLNTVNYCT